MSQTNQPTHQRKLIEKAIKQGAKRIIAASGIEAATRKGNKELDFLVKRLARQSFASHAAATQFGEALGEKIVAQSQQLGRQHLDQGVIRQLMLRSDLPIADAPPLTQSVAPTTKPSQPIVRPEPIAPVAEAITGTVVSDEVEAEEVATASTNLELDEENDQQNEIESTETNEVEDNLTNDADAADEPDAEIADGGEKIDSDKPDAESIDLEHVNYSDDIINHADEDEFNNLVEGETENIKHDVLNSIDELDENETENKLSTLNEEVEDLAEEEDADLVATDLNQ